MMLKMVMVTLIMNLTDENKTLAYSADKNQTFKTKPYPKKNKIFWSTKEASWNDFLKLPNQVGHTIWSIKTAQSRQAHLHVSCVPFHAFKKQSTASLKF